MSTPNIKGGNETLGGKKGFKQFLDGKTIEKLDKLATRYNRPNKQRVIEEIIFNYLPAWERAQKLTPTLANAETAVR